MKRYAMLIGAAASALTAGSAALSLSNASAVPPGPGRGFGFIARRAQPVAGHLFLAVVVVNRDPSSQTIRRVRCDAQVGTERLRGRQRRYFAPPYDAAADIACSWRIPADAGGRKLRLWHYRSGRHVAVSGVVDGSGVVTESRSYSWLVKH